MAFVPAANVVEVVIDQVYEQLPVANVIHFAAPAAVTSTTLTGIADALEDWLLATYAPLKHLGWSVNRLRLRDLTTQEGITLERTPASAIVGELSGSPLPGSIALCVSLRSAFAGRSRRGRFYCTGHTQAQLDTIVNQFSASAVSAHVSALNSLRTAFVGSTPLCVISRVSNGVPRSTALITPITSVLSTDATVDSQRGRVR